MIISKNTLLLSFFVLMAVDAYEVSSLNGNWQNQLGSIVEFSFNPDGTLTGNYTTKVGVSTRAEPLFGKWFRTNADLAVLAGFTVGWSNVQPGKPQSLTSWSGQILLSDDQPLMFNTSWLLVSDYPRGDSWRNTNIGQDHFIKLSQ